MAAFGHMMQHVFRLAKVWYGLQASEGAGVLFLFAELLECSQAVKDNDQKSCG